MKRSFLVLVCLLLTSASFAFNPADGANSWSSDSKSLTISSTTISPTQILTKDSYIARTWIINTSTFTLLLSTFSTTLSPTTSVSVPASTVFSPDGPATPYWGPMFAVIVGTSTASAGNNISILRTK